MSGSGNTPKAGPSAQSRIAAATVEHVRVCTIRPKDVLVDARGDVIGTVTVTAHPSPVDYDKTSEFTLELADGGRQDFELPAGVRVWRQR